MQLTAELKQRTAAIHQAAEKKMIQSLKRITTEEDYVQMLNWLYGFYSPMEELAHQQLTPETFPEIIKRSRAEAILCDIMDFNTVAPEPDICRQLPVDRPLSPGQRDEIIAGAEDTFITFKNWIDEHELQPQL